MISGNLGLRTDLALESANSVRTDKGLPEGVECRTHSVSGFTVTDVKVATPEAARVIGKPAGRYLTLEPEAPLDLALSDFEAAAELVSSYIGELLGGNKDSVLVAGLGNSSVTPDSLGPRVFSHIFSTRHIKREAPSLLEEDAADVSAIAPGVMGQTGLEPSEVLIPVIKSAKPSAVIVVDALACSDPKHLGKTIQLTDTGIHPGSGVMNERKELSSSSLGLPTIAIGVPTIADTGEDGKSLMVTPKSIDKLVSGCALLISMGINRCLNPGLSQSDIRLLTS